VPAVASREGYQSDPARQPPRRGRQEHRQPKRQRTGQQLD